MNSWVPFCLLYDFQKLTTRNGTTNLLCSWFSDICKYASLALFKYVSIGKYFDFFDACGQCFSAKVCIGLASLSKSQFPLLSDLLPIFISNHLPGNAWFQDTVLCGQVLPKGFCQSGMANPDQLREKCRNYHRYDLKKPFGPDTNYIFHYGCSDHRLCL